MKGFEKNYITRTVTMNLLISHSFKLDQNATVENTNYID